MRALWVWSRILDGSKSVDIPENKITFEHTFQIGDRSFPQINKRHGRYKWGDKPLPIQGIKETEKKQETHQDLSQGI